MKTTTREMRTERTRDTPAGEPGGDRVEQLAYQYWEARGRPDGSPEEDWFRAERDMRRAA